MVLGAFPDNGGFGDVRVAVEGWIVLAHRRKFLNAHRTPPSAVVFGQPKTKLCVRSEGSQTIVAAETLRPLHWERQNRGAMHGGPREIVRCVSGLRSNRFYAPTFCTSLTPNCFAAFVPII